MRGDRELQAQAGKLRREAEGGGEQVEGDESATTSLWLNLNVGPTP